MGRLARTAGKDGLPPQRTFGDASVMQASWRESGAGPVAVLAAGLGLSSEFYADSYRRFAAAGVRLVVPDLPGWGRTPGRLTGISPGDTAEFLESFSGALGLPPAIWIGHSLGAQAVSELARVRPERVRGLVLVGPTGRDRHRELLRQVGALALEATRISRHTFAGVLQDYLRTPPQRYLGTWLRHGGHSLAAALSEVQCPTLILAGDRDPVCTAAFVDRLATVLPRGEVAWVRGGTHALPRGCPDEFAGLATEFVRRQGAADAQAGERP
jgi:2-hydroxy-6-oxonona-2,4-dienedioate hydrolase